jgi:hypothetical protein
LRGKEGRESSLNLISTAKVVSRRGREKRGREREIPSFHLILQMSESFLIWRITFAYLAALKEEGVPDVQVGLHGDAEKKGC